MPELVWCDVLITMGYLRFAARVAETIAGHFKQTNNREHWWAFLSDYRELPEESVLKALLARQTTLALELSSAPQLWNSHSAPLFLRAMADVHITLAWILLEPEARVQQYIEHGLGQAVLDMEHRKKRMDSEDETRKAELQIHIDGLRSWIDMQRLSFIVEVNVGAWSGKTTREMAEQAGLLEFYSYVYSPFSQCAHSTWYHVGQLNSGFRQPVYSTARGAPDCRVGNRSLEFDPSG